MKQDSSSDYTIGLSIVVIGLLLFSISGGLYAHSLFSSLDEYHVAAVQVSEQPNAVEKDLTRYEKGIIENAPVIPPDTSLNTVYSETTHPKSDKEYRWLNSKPSQFEDGEIITVNGHDYKLQITERQSLLELEYLLGISLGLLLIGLGLKRKDRFRHELIKESNEYIKN